ncbi:hypothetical protein GY45DRAFT_945594 [Cubamyces sp. BRFM 1775]|nr:hypothetical protein GY45DRAFT_945594 [Cubamyces sp. BRFM 1775]
MSPSDQALLQWFNSKLNLLYYHHSPPCTGTDASEAIIVKGCDLRVCTLLRTFKSSDGSIDVDFDPPQVVHCPGSPDKYHLKINICKFRSPGDCVGSSASVVVEITSVQKPCWLEGDVSATPTYMTLHQLVFQPAKVVDVLSYPQNQSNSPVIEAALSEYMRSLGEGHLSTLLAQCCPSLDEKPNAPVRPQPREEDFNIYLQLLWGSLIAPVTPHAEHIKKKLTGINLSRHVELMLTFEGPPTVSYSPQSKEVEFCFDIILNGSNSKRFLMRFSVGKLVTHGSRSGGMYTAYHIDKDKGKALYRNTDGVSDDPCKYDIIATIRDKYIPRLWAYGFDTLYTSSNLVRVCEEQQPSPGALNASRELYMGSHAFVAAVSQTSINAHFLGKVVPVVGSGASKPIAGDPTPSNGQTTINFTSSHIRLLSDNQAILWVQIDRVAATQVRRFAEEDQIHREGASLRLALHMKLRIRPPSAVSSANLSLYEVYLDTADVQLLPQYSALPAGGDNATIHQLVELVWQEYILRLGQDNQNVIARVPVPTTASTTGYTIRTMFRHYTSTITATNWYEIVTESPTPPPPILLVYDMLEDLADSPSWDPFLGDELAISTLAITKDAFIEQVILPQLARYNEVTALIPTAQLTCDCPCPSAVYLMPSGDGWKAMAEKWTPTDDAFSQTYLFKRAYCVGERVSVESDVTNGGPAVSDPLLRDVFARQLYICKTENRLTISKSIDSDWTVTMTGSVELQSNDPAKVTARLTWNWAVIQSKASDIDIRPTAFKTVLDSLETEPPLEDEVAVLYSTSEEPSPDDASKKKSQALAKRLKDAFCGIVQKTNLPDPLSSMSDMVAVDGDFVLGKYVRRNEAGELFVDLYPKATPGAPLANGDSHGGASSI